MFCQNLPKENYMLTTQNNQDTDPTLAAQNVDSNTRQAQNVDSNNRKIGPSTVEGTPQSNPFYKDLAVEKKQYGDNVIVTGETFNGNKFEHKLYFQNGATKDEVENMIRAREPSAQRGTLKIVQGETNAQAVERQKKVDASKGPRVAGVRTDERGNVISAPAPTRTPTPTPTPAPEEGAWRKRL